LKPRWGWTEIRNIVQGTGSHTPIGYIPILFKPKGPKFTESFSLRFTSQNTMIPTDPAFSATIVEDQTDSIAADVDSIMEADAIIDGHINDVSM
jgi:hypothetical protein